MTSPRSARAGRRRFLRALRPLAEFDPYLIEEPFGPEDIESQWRLADAVPLTIAPGEIAGGE
jgi:L-alanine-DL-glutamate epimerase-like enolase superfamily enzyme